MNSNRDLLIQAANNYYAGNPTGMDDKTYDELLKSVKEEDPSFDIFQYVNVPGDDRTDVMHYYPYINQEFKIQFSDQDEMVKINDQFINTDWIGTVKLDGCSVSAYYRSGRLFDILTRSNETSGKRKLDQLKNKVPEVVDSNVIKIDFEAVCSKEDFSDDTRSNANGLINSCYKQDEVDQYIQLIPFRVYTTQKMGYIEAMHLAGFTTDQIPLLKIDEQKFENRYYSYYNGKHYPIDGIVYYDKNNNYCNHKIYKHYYNQDVVTTVRGITWRFTDKLSWTPKLEFDTVKIDGRNVSRCTSNGYGRLSSIKAGVGSKITVILANSTIPQIGKVIEPSEDYQLIQECPFCHSKMEIVNAKLRCTNTLCPALYEGLSNELAWTLKKLYKCEYDLVSKSEDEFREKYNKLPDEDRSKISINDLPTIVAESMVLERYSPGRIDATTEQVEANFKVMIPGEPRSLFDALPLTYNQTLVMETYQDCILSMVNILFKL